MVCELNVLHCWLQSGFKFHSGVSKRWEEDEKYVLKSPSETAEDTVVYFLFKLDIALG